MVSFRFGVDDRTEGWDDLDVGVEGLVPPCDVGVEGRVRLGAVLGEDLDLEIPFGVVEPESRIDICRRGLGLPRVPFIDSAGEYVDDLRDFVAEDALV